MNIKHITGAISLCALCALNVSASRGHGVFPAENRETENTISDDSIRIKGSRDKAYNEASIKIDSVKLNNLMQKKSKLSFYEKKFFNKENQYRDNEKKVANSVNDVTSRKCIEEDDDRFLIRYH